VTSTQTVTAINGAVISGGIVDANADSYLRFQAVTAWSAYATEADALAGTNALGSGTASDTFRFQYTAGVQFFVAIYTATGARITQLASPAAVGETVVSLDNQSILNEVVAVSNQILEDTDELQQSQGNWITATGYQSEADAAARAAADQDAHAATQSVLTNLSTDVNVISIAGTSVTGPDDLKGDGMTEGSLHAALDSYANKANWKDGITAAQIATEVQAGILNEGDGQQVIDAIVQAIGNENIAAATIAAEVWAYATRDLTNPVDLTTLETRVSEIAAIHGLDLANPLVTTPTTRSSGTISQNISGNGVTESTITRTS